MIEIINDIKWEYPIYVFDNGKFLGKLYNALELDTLRYNLCQENDYKRLDLITYFGDFHIDSNGYGLEKVVDNQISKYYLDDWTYMLSRIIKKKCEYGRNRQDICE